MKTNKFDKEDTYYGDYPSEPCGGSNPNWKCCSCGATHPQINGRLAGHFDGCKWVEEKMRQLVGEDNSNNKELLQEAITMLAEWCVAVEDNGAGWDDWDEYYKDANWRPCKIRELIDAEKERIRINK